MKKRILVIGSGGREHAIVKALKKSDKVEKIFCAPGNAGIARDAECVAIGPEDIEALVNFAQRNEIDLTIVGPEASLAAGISDAMEALGLKVFGPSKAATQIESSKEFAKKLMKKYNIPTADYQSFEDFEKALEYVKKSKMPTVIKYDGLAAGKGVVIAENLEEAEAALRDILLDKSFGGGKVVIEEFLSGPEFSFMAMVNGDKVYPLEIAQDHKRAYDGDRGPNTGGMGAFSPVEFITPEIKERALKEILQPTAKALKEEGVPFLGLLYGGLILTEEGPKVIEFNARFGDPETEVVLPRLKSDFLDLIEAVIEGKDFKTEWSPEACLGVVLASKGYPGSYKKGSEIKGLENVKAQICHMGTKLENDKLLTAGGRVLMVIGSGKTVEEANRNCREEIAKIDCPDLFHRTDIGKAVLN